MAIVKWKINNSGDFNTAGDWTPAQIPTTTDDVEIDVPGAVTVTSSISNTVNTLETAASVTLAVTAGTFSINSGSGPGGLNGTIAVNGNATLMLGGNIVNTGTIKLGSTADTGVLRISSPLLTLQGGGTIALSNNASNLIYGNSGSFTLNNVNNIIAGAGQLGDGQLTFVNGGQVVANQTIALVLDTGNYVKNTGILKSTNTAANAGGLVILNTSVDNSGKANAGKIEAIGANTHVDLQNSTIIGGTLITSGGGVIQTIANNSATLDGVSAGVAITNKGTVLVKDTSTLTLDGVINNSGVIRLASTVDQTRIVLNSQTVTLQGGGSLILSNSANNFIYGNSGLYQLVNVDNMISGAGQLGDGQISLINQGSGVINANQRTALTVNGGGGGSQIINSGLMEDTGAGGLILNNLIDNGGGTIKAVGAGAQVDLSGADIEGGTLIAATGGTIRTVGSNTLDGFTVGAITTVGSVAVTDQTTLYLAGTINNTGTIALGGISATGVTDLRLSSQTVTLLGHGKVTLSNNANNRIFGNSGSYQLINMDNTISGAGQLGANQIELTNGKAGVINANQTTALTLSSNDVVNNGLMEGTGGGGLMILNSMVNNALGKIIANGKGAVVTLSGGYIEGGTITTANGGVIQTAGGSNNLDGITAGGLENTGTVLVSDNTSLALEGYFSNSGTIRLGSGVDQTNLVINSQRVVLKGGGSVTLSNSAVNRIYGNSSYNQLINMDNTISGAGQLGAGQLTLVNQFHGKIIANQKTALIVNVGGMPIDNAGLMECTGTGGLIINNSTVDNDGGNIAAIGKGTHVDLAGATIESGTLKTASGGIIQTVGGNGNLDGVTAGALTIAGTVKVADSTSLTLEGVINNTGTINLAAASTNLTNLILSGETVTLQGKGKVVLSNFSANRIYGNSGVFTLNNLNNTIIGGGQIGAGQMQFTNGGTIKATGTAGMTVSLGSGIGTNMASGVMEATGTGGMTFSSGYISNLGRIIALNGSSLTFNGATVSNNANGVLTGGTWSAVSTAQLTTVSLAGGAVTDDAATIILSGTKSVFQAGNNGSFTTLEQSLTAIDTNGALQLLNSRSYTTALDMGVSGTLQLGGGAFKARSLAVSSGGKILGFGTVTDPFANAGLIDAKGGTLDVTGSITGAGKLAIEAGASLKLDGAVGASETLGFAGTNSQLILTDSTAFAATISTFGGATESIDLTTVAFNSGTALTYSTTSHILNATDGTHSASLKLFQQYVASGFHEASDGHGGTLITYIQPSAHEPMVVAAHH